MPTHINDFKSAIARRGGISKTNRFSVLITLPQQIRVGTDAGRDLDLLCETAQLPGKQIMTTEYSLYGHAIKIPTGFILEDVNLTFNITNDYYVKNIFDNWQDLVISPDTYNLAYDDVFKSDIHIRQLDDNDKVVFTTILFGAYPFSVQAITLDNGADNTTQKLNVQFCYNDWKKVSEHFASDGVKGKNQLNRDSIVIPDPANLV